jgi:SAM-dependent methyltransferase
MFRAILRNAGIKPRVLFSACRGWRRFVRDRRMFRALPGADEIPWGNELPVLGEWSESSGGLGAYFFQDRLVAKWIKDTAPVRHVDVGSRLDGFVGMLSVFREVEVIDIRPAPYCIPQVTFHQLDLMAELPGEWIQCADSLSCLHTIEHFGLGRYGDPLDPLGHHKGLRQLKRMVKPGGLLYLSTPLGPSRVEFNAHRVFALRELTGWFADDWQIERVAIIDDENRVRESVDWLSEEASGNFGCRLGVAIIAARKRNNPVAPE